MPVNSILFKVIVFAALLWIVSLHSHTFLIFQGATILYFIWAVTQHKYSSNNYWCSTIGHPYLVLIVKIFHFRKNFKICLLVFLIRYVPKSNEKRSSLYARYSMKIFFILLRIYTRTWSGKVIKFLCVNFKCEFLTIEPKKIWSPLRKRKAITLWKIHMNKKEKFGGRGDRRKSRKKRWREYCWECRKHSRVTADGNKFIFLLSLYLQSIIWSTTIAVIYAWANFRDVRVKLVPNMWVQNCQDSATMIDIGYLV